MIGKESPGCGRMHISALKILKFPELTSSSGPQPQMTHSIHMILLGYTGNFQPLKPGPPWQNPESSPVYVQLILTTDLDLHILN